MKKIGGILAVLFLLSLCSGIASAENNKGVSDVTKTVSQAMASIKKAIGNATLVKNPATSEERAAVLKEYGFPKEVIEEYSEYEYMILLIYENCANSSIKDDIVYFLPEDSSVEKIQLPSADVRAVLFDIDTEGPYWFPPYRPAPLRLQAFDKDVNIASLKDGKLTLQEEQIDWDFYKEYRMPNESGLQLWQNPQYYLSKVKEVIEKELNFCAGKLGNAKKAVKVFSSIDPSAYILDEDPYAKPSNWGFDDDD